MDMHHPLRAHNKEQASKCQLAVWSDDSLAQPGANTEIGRQWLYAQSYTFQLFSTFVSQEKKLEALVKYDYYVCYLKKSF